MLGQNVAGLAAKLDSLHSVVNSLLPSAILSQESKQKSIGKIKLKGSSNFSQRNFLLRFGQNRRNQLNYTLPLIYTLQKG